MRSTTDTNSYLIAQLPLIFLPRSVSFAIRTMQIQGITPITATLALGVFLGYTSLQGAIGVSLLFLLLLIGYTCALYGVILSHIKRNPAAKEGNLLFRLIAIREAAIVTCGCVKKAMTPVIEVIVPPLITIGSVVEGAVLKIIETAMELGSRAMSCLILWHVGVVLSVALVMTPDGKERVKGECDSGKQQ